MKLAILCPVYNDWASFLSLLGEITTALEDTDIESEIILVNDGSQEAAPQQRIQDLIGGKVSTVRLITLTHNVGHQKAIAIGLAFIAKHLVVDGVVVMDADGEDPPRHIPTLIDRHRATRAPIVVAQRGRRFENMRFRLLYQCFRSFFRMITGYTIDFGNYSFLSRSTVDRLVQMPELLAHYPATLLLSKLPIEKVRLDRGHRYAGRSRMDIPSLILHALGGTSAFVDRVFVRLLVGLGILLMISVSIIIIVLIMKIFYVPTPGWTTTVVGTQILLIFQAFAFALGGLLIALNSKRNLNPPATAYLDSLIADVVILRAKAGVRQVG